MANITELIDVLNVKKKYNLNFFIETGTGMGESIEKIKDIDFNLIQSCEIEPSQFEILCKKFIGDNIKIHLGKSTECLPKMIGNIDGPSLFFLDAHFPGQGYVTNDFITSKYTLDETIPLKLELNILENWKHIKESVVVIDDLRIYKKNNYVTGDWEYGREELLKNPDPSFLDDFLKESHEKIESNIQQGCVYYYPKQKI